MTVELSRKEILKLEVTYPSQNYHHFTALYNYQVCCEVNTVGVGGWQWLLIQNIARKLEIL